VTLVFNDTFIFNDVITEFESDYKSFHYFLWRGTNQTLLPVGLDEDVLL